MKTFVVILVLAVNLVNAGYIPQQNQVEETKLVTRPRTVVEKSGLARSDFDRQLKTSIVNLLVKIIRRTFDKVLPYYDSGFVLGLGIRPS